MFDVISPHSRASRIEQGPLTSNIRLIGDVAELVYAYVSEAYGAILEGSSPSIPTIYLNYNVFLAHCRFAAWVMVYEYCF